MAGGRRLERVLSLREYSLYATAALEGADIHRDTFMNLVRLLAGPFTVEADAPKGFCRKMPANHCG